MTTSSSPSLAALTRAGRSLLLALPLALPLAIAACGGESTKPEPSRATRIELVTAPPQSAPAGSVVPTLAFVVKDQRDATMRNVPVALAVTGGGSLQSPATLTTGTEPTPVAGWRLGERTGTNTLTLTVEGIAPVVLTVVGVTGPIGRITAITSEQETGIVGKAVVQPPRVRITDAYDNVVAGATATVTVTGGGTAPATITADGNGIAQVGQWTLGTVAGAQSLTITAGTASRTFTVNAQPGPAVQLAVVGGSGQSTLAGRALPQPIIFAAQDEYGNTIANQRVDVTIRGGGSFTPLAYDFRGRATTTWTLGKSAVPQSLVATLDTLTVTATATVSTNFTLEVRFAGTPMSAAHQAAFTAAAARVNAMIVGDVQNATTGGDFDLGAACGASYMPVVNEIVDDLVIYATAMPMDGPGGLLGRAGPCITRTSGAKLPVYGMMEFDSDDLDRMQRDGTLESVILHEMLHVVGVGTYWQLSGFLVGIDSAHVSFTGPRARAECVAEGGPMGCSGAVPVENQGGPGTQNSHWRESVFDTELMTGWENAPRIGGVAAPLPLSRMTIGSLGDIGYGINLDAADVYRVPSSALVRGVRPLGTPRQEAERIVPRFALTPDGRAIPLAAP